LQDHGVKGQTSFGVYLGWAMAVIYMSGRLPQICLNVSYIFSCAIHIFDNDNMNSRNILKILNHPINFNFTIIFINFADQKG
jgi:hypothetical protein